MLAHITKPPSVSLCTAVDDDARSLRFDRVSSTVSYGNPLLIASDRHLVVAVNIAFLMPVVQHFPVGGILFVPLATSRVLT